MRKSMVATEARVFVMLTFSVLLAGQAWAATRWVNDNDPNGGGYAPPGTSCNDPGYATIQAAVTAASTGDTIMVCPGLYAEQVQINKTLTLLGAQAGVDARTRPFVVANESIIDHPCGPVQIMANQVVLDGLTVQGSVLPDPCFLAGIWTNPGFSGTQGGHQILRLAAVEVSRGASTTPPPTPKWAWSPAPLRAASPPGEAALSRLIACTWGPASS